jgi:hypothetical protein
MGENSNAHFTGTKARLPLRGPHFQPIERRMGQQHRVRAKRKRRMAYLRRKKESLRATRPKTPKVKTTKKQPAAAE